MSSSKIFFPRDFTAILRPEPVERTSFMLRDLTSARCRQTFTAVFSKMSYCVLITFLVAFSGFLPSFSHLFFFPLNVCLKLD